MTTESTSAPSPLATLTIRSCVNGRCGMIIILDATVDVRGFEDPDQDRELTFAVNFLEVDDLVLCEFGDDDPSQLHLDGHGTAELVKVARGGADLAAERSVYKFSERKLVATRTSRPPSSSRLRCWQSILDAMDVIAPRSFGLDRPLPPTRDGGGRWRAGEG